MSKVDGSVTMRPAPAPETWFARYDALAAADHGVAAPGDLPKRWVDAAALIRAQLHPNGPQRRWFEECERGFVSAHVDPVMLAEWLERLPAILPSLDRDRRGIASYVQVVLSWTGISLMERECIWRPWSCGGPPMASPGRKRYGGTGMGSRNKQGIATALVSTRSMGGKRGVR